MLVNLTQHDIIIHSVINGVPSRTTVIPSGIIARVAATFTPAGDVDMGVNTFRRTFGAVTDLPAPRDGVILIVSALVAAASPRADVFSPGDLIRNDAGQPIGCRGLVSSL